MELIITKAARTRQLIIEKAAHLFNQKGYAGTSMQDIMAATGLTKGGIYGHFESKEEIVLAAFGYATDYLVKLISDKLAAHTTASGKLQALLSFYKSYLLAPPIVGGCPVLNTSVEADDTNPQLRTEVIKVLDRLHKAVAGIVQQGVAQGEFRASANPEQFAILFVSMVEGGIMVSKAYGNPKHLNTVLRHLELHIANELKA